MGLCLRFDDGAKANLIVDFNSWEYTYVKTPEVIDPGHG